MPLALILSGQRRMEAETYLASGFGIRVSIEARKTGLADLADIARVWQPSRLKGIQVSRDFGTPFLAATQVFDLRPVARKWLSLDRTDESANRFVGRGQILVTCSGNVGRAGLAQQALAGVLISHDLLRVEPRESEWWGWLYAYLRAPEVREMMKATQYGHIIKHLETGHLDRLPIFKLRADLLAEFNSKVRRIMEQRDEAYRLSLQAEQRFEKSIGVFEVRDTGEAGFTVKASRAIFSGRRRLDALPHNPVASATYRHLKRRGRDMVALTDLGFDVWLPTRFRRVPADDGVELMDSSDLFEINPDRGRIIAEDDFGDPFRGRVTAGWILVARSGQIYGLNGSVAMATAAHEGKVISDDIIRVAPKGLEAVRAGYVFVALSHPTLGRPLVKSLIYGSSVPHLDVTDVKRIEVVRLSAPDEQEIADLADGAFRCWSDADLLEERVAADASELVERFIAGQRSFLAES